MTKFNDQASVAEARVDQARRDGARRYDAGQQATYFAKMLEARDVLAAGADKKKLAQLHIPHLTAEAKLRGVEVPELAGAVISEYRRWSEGSAKIEAGRVAVKQSIARAKDNGKGQENG